MLSERQSHFEREIFREVSRAGGWITTWPSEKYVRFELLKEDAHIGQQIGEAFGRWGLHTVELGQSERGTPWGLAPTTVYEIALPKDKPPSPQSHYGELADPAEKARRRRLGIR